MESSWRICSGVGVDHRRSGTAQLILDKAGHASSPLVRAVKARAAGGAVELRPRQAQPGILADAPEEGGPRRQVAQYGCSGVAAVAARNQLPLSLVGALIQTLPHARH